MKSCSSPPPPRITRVSGLPAVMLGAVDSPPCLATDPERKEEGRNEAAFFVGGTAEAGITAFTLGAEYERRITQSARAGER